MSSFDRFVETVGVRVRAGLVAAYGFDAGQDAAAEAMAYAWEHWDDVSRMENPSGYLYRVGQSAARRARRPASPRSLFPSPIADREGFEFEPGLAPALATLSEMQRICVMLVVAFHVSQAEVARMLEVDPSTVRNHVERAMRSLKKNLEVVHGDR